MALINGDICPTRFITDIIELPDVPIGEKVYKTWDPILQNLVKQNKIKTVEVPSNRVIYFNSDSFHEGTRAKSRGWRWFGRATYNSLVKPMNEIRNQVQIYMDDPSEGW